MPITAHEARVRAAAASHNHDELARELNVYGDALRKLGGRSNLLEALALHEREMQISQQYLPPREEVIARRFMADCLRELGRSADAVRAYKRCLRDLKELDETDEVQRIQCNLGHCFSENANAQFDDDAFVNAEVHYRLVHQALPAFRQALRLALDNVASRKGRLQTAAQTGGARGDAAAGRLFDLQMSAAEAFLNLGNALVTNMDYAEALQALEAAVKTFVAATAPITKRKQRGQRLTRTEEARLRRAQEAMGPCFFEVAQAYIGMNRADCLPKAMHNLKEDLALCRSVRSRCAPGQVPRARVTEAKTLLSMANVHYQAGRLAQAVQAARDAARVCAMAGERGADVLADIEANIHVYMLAQDTAQQVAQLEKQLRAARRRGDPAAVLRTLLASDAGLAAAAGTKKQRFDALLDVIGTLQSLVFRSRRVELLAVALERRHAALLTPSMRHSLCYEQASELYHLRRFPEALRKVKALAEELADSQQVSLQIKVETEELLATVMEACPKPNMAVVVKVYQDAFRKSQALGDVVVQERILDALVQGLNNAGRVKEARKLLPQLRTLHASIIADDPQSTPSAGDASTPQARQEHAAAASRIQRLTAAADGDARTQQKHRSPKRRRRDSTRGGGAAKRQRPATTAVRTLVLGATSSEDEDEEDEGMGRQAPRIIEGRHVAALEPPFELMPQPRGALTGKKATAVKGALRDDLDVEVKRRLEGVLEACREAHAWAAEKGLWQDNGTGASLWAAKLPPRRIGGVCIDPQATLAAYGDDEDIASALSSVSAPLRDCVAPGDVVQQLRYAGDNANVAASLLSAAGDWRTAAEYHHQDLICSALRRHSDGMVTAYRNIAVGLMEEGAVVAALQNLRQAVRLARPASPQLQGALVELGRCWVSCVEHWEDSMDDNENDAPAPALPGWVAAALERGVASHRLSVQVAEELQDKERQAIGLCNLGTALSLGSKPDFSAAIAALQQSKRLAPTLSASGRAVFGLGKVYAKQGKWARAAQYFSVDADVCASERDTHGEWTSLRAWSAALLQQWDLPAAVSVLERTERLLRRGGGEEWMAEAKDVGATVSAIQHVKRCEQRVADASGDTFAKRISAHIALVEAIHAVRARVRAPQKPLLTAAATLFTTLQSGVTTGTVPRLTHAAAMQVLAQAAAQCGQDSVAEDGCQSAIEQLQGATASQERNERLSACIIAMVQLWRSACANPSRRSTALAALAQAREAADATGDVNVRRPVLAELQWWYDHGAADDTGAASVKAALDALPTSRSAAAGPHAVGTRTPRRRKRITRAQRVLAAHRRAVADAALHRARAREERQEVIDAVVVADGGRQRGAGSGAASANDVIELGHDVDEVVQRGPSTPPPPQLSLPDNDDDVIVERGPSTPPPPQLVLRDNDVAEVLPRVRGTHSRARQDARPVADSAVAAAGTMMRVHVGDDEITVSLTERMSGTALMDAVSKAFEARHAARPQIVALKYIDDESMVARNAPVRPAAGGVRAEVSEWHVPSLTTAYTAQAGIADVAPVPAVAARLEAAADAAVSGDTEASSSQGTALSGSVDVTSATLRRLGWPCSQCQALARGPARVAVCFRGTWLAGQDAVPAVHALWGQHTVAHVDLDGVHLEPPAADALARVLKPLPRIPTSVSPPTMRLQSLVLSSCMLGDDALSRVLAAVVASPSKPSLNRLSIAHNVAGTATAQALADVLIACPSLAVVDATDCGMGAAAAHAFASRLRSSTQEPRCLASLRWLRLAMNPLTGPPIVAIIRAFAHWVQRHGDNSGTPPSQSSTPSALISLDVRNCCGSAESQTGSVSDPVAAVMSELRGRRRPASAARRLSLPDDAWAAAFSTFTRLLLAGNTLSRCGGAIAKAIARSREQHWPLRELDLTCCRLTPDDCDAITAALREGSSLHSVTLHAHTVDAASDHTSAAASSLVAGCRVHRLPGLSRTAVA